MLVYKAYFSILLIFAACLSTSAQIVDSAQQSILTAEAGPEDASVNRVRGEKILKEVKETIEKHYYDKTYKGIDLDSTYKAAREKIKTFDHNWQIFRVIAQFVMQFDDSHTRFYPPNRAVTVDYGFDMQMIGNVCYIVNVKKGSDAEKKGLKVGDVLAGIHQYNPTRENLWKINYILRSLDPLSKINVFILGPDKKEQKIEVEAKFISIKARNEDAKERRKNFEPYRCHEVDAEVIACRLETFSVDKDVINDMMKEVRGHGRLVLDLRGNGGGLVEIEEYLLGHFFDTDIKVGDFVTRKKTEERIAKSRGDKVFKGDLTVLIDSRSASAAEVFARVIQIEERGKVMGDVSSGSVMTSYLIGSSIRRGSGELMTLTVFSMNVTVGDLIMTDGKRLEKVGVTPDVAIGPSGFALSNGDDPILAHAVRDFGGEMTDAEAGQLKFLTKRYNWSEDEDLEDQ
ncbi:MAG: hypothetical protein DWQ47_02815 [Acidobacteria bacterium]|nr:MAG: hypothetical protein DWQ32_06365 [Acidobacteriota bacterium]REK01339.1 MAG: hypothetical protein DWQ38_02800 [Acidobacteriota bacterium]REK14295.1 MAG: hypothetical protein DWQ43_12055 [Acidobacteriota bacterium]REK45010.1 MAG: hypothetical protein DWQ47_02815 [Acidobacteriota bacterium]